MPGIEERLNRHRRLVVEQDDQLVADTNERDLFIGDTGEVDFDLLIVSEIDDDGLITKRLCQPEDAGYGVAVRNFPRRKPEQPEKVRS